MLYNTILYTYRPPIIRPILYEQVKYSDPHYEGPAHIKWGRYIIRSMLLTSSSVALDTPDGWWKMTSNISGGRTVAVLRIILMVWRWLLTALTVARNSPGGWKGAPDARVASRGSWYYWKLSSYSCITDTMAHAMAIRWLLIIFLVVRWAPGGWTVIPRRVNGRGERSTRPRNSRTVTNALARCHKNPITSRWWKVCVESQAIVGCWTGPVLEEAELRYRGDTLQ